VAKAEISWKRVTADGEKLQVYARQVGDEWRFFHRGKRYDIWQAVPKPPLEDWLELLDAVRRMIPRRRLMPRDEEQVLRRIREKFPEADTGPAQFPP
jgi:hypothetical protein